MSNCVKAARFTTGKSGGFFCVFNSSIALSVLQDERLEEAFSAYGMKTAPSSL